MNNRKPLTRAQKRERREMILDGIAATAGMLMLFVGLFAFMLVAPR